MAKKLTNEEFKKRGTIKHKGKYDYSETEYVDNKTPIKIICPIHGEFLQTPNSHLQGKGCQKCGHEATNNKNKNKRKSAPKNRKLKYDTDNIIERIKKVYGEKYGVSEVEYKGINKKIKLICPKHGSFPITPAHLFEGRGCPKCNTSKMEEEIRDILNENGIEYIEQYNTKDLDRLKIDFFIPNKNIGIECQGEQHFKMVEHFGGNADYKKRLERDSRKRKVCKELGIELIYFMHSYHDIEGIKCFSSKDDLIGFIT